jgi:hypothetical protein
MELRMRKENKIKKTMTRVEPASNASEYECTLCAQELPSRF